jgi:hypothetical protein
MAGKKGRSGGAREGSGRKPAKPRKTRAKAYQTDDPDDFLRAVMRDPLVPFNDRMAAALALKKSGSAGAPKGKKEQAAAKAKEVMGVRSLAPMPPPSRPRLVSVK